MTSFTSAVTRRSLDPFVRYGPDKKRIVVTLESIGGQGDFITLRLERRRQGHRIDVADLYALLVRKSVDCARMEKLRAKIGRKRKVRRK